MSFISKNKVAILSAVFFAAGLNAFAQEAIVAENETEPASISESAESTIPEGKFRLNKVIFNSKKNTKPSILRRNIEPIKYDKVFESKELFEEYIADIKQELVNTRLLDDIEVSWMISGQTEDEVNLVDATYTFTDSHSMIIFPKPKFSSNDGVEVKIKLKDNNFLGLMNDFNIDFNFNLGDENHPNDYSRVKAGFNFSYDLPFFIGRTKDTWKNDLDLSMNFAEGEPEFSYTTGLTIGVPVGIHQMNITATQGITRDLNYKPYGDELYFTESFSIAMPFKIGYIGNTIPVIYSPLVGVTYIWDADGISEDSLALRQTPMIRPGQIFSISKVNWNENGNNLRSGFLVSTGQYLGYDFHEHSLTKSFVPSVEGTIELYKAWKNFGFAFRTNVFAGLNLNANMGEKIRGALDNQKIDKAKYGTIDVENKALVTPCYVVFNFDMPIHLFTTNWYEWGYRMFGAYDDLPDFWKKTLKVPHKIFKYIDFEMQINPFIDVGLLSNRATGKTLDPREGIYTTGLEVLVYPLKWKSFVVRGSIGYDVGSKFLNGKKGFDSDWRDPSKLYEIYFGLGTHF